MKRKIISAAMAIMLVFTTGVGVFAAVTPMSTTTMTVRPAMQVAAASPGAMQGGGTPPQMPDGNGTPPEMPGGEGNMPPGMSDASNISWSGATTVTSADTQSGKIYSSASADENALLIDTADSVTITNPTVTKSGGTSASDNYSFYGINSGIMVKGGADVTITGGTVNTDAAGANGVFCYGANNGITNAAGDGTTINISGTTITTTGDGSGGIMDTFGGTINASNLTVTTSGRSSAPIRTDRGGGLVTVDGGTYTSDGLGSPAIYSTADVKVSNATLTSNLSEGVCIEGTGSVTLTDCDLTASNTGLNGNATFNDTIMIYQSMSGDASNGTSSFTMTGGTLTSNNGHVFHVTNTTAVVSLSDVNIVNNDSENILISVCDDGWNGGNNRAAVNADNQTLSGTILVGSNSMLILNLSNGSTFAGKISGEIENAKGTTVSSSVGTVYVTLSDDSTWTLAGDTYITGFSGNAENVITNGYTLYVNGTALSESGTYTSADGVELVTSAAGNGSGFDGGNGNMPAPSDTQGGGSTAFTDVKENNWFYTYVTALSKDGVVNGMGDGTFAPQNTLTWAQAMKLLLCAHGDLTGITGSSWATTSMNKAAELGLCAASENGSVGISRLDFCKAAAQLFSVSGTSDKFSDCEDSSVLAMAGAGIINGYPDGSFGPDKTITRAEISKVIYLLQQLQAQGK